MALRIRTPQHCEFGVWRQAQWCASRLLAWRLLLGGWCVWHLMTWVGAGAPGGRTRHFCISLSTMIPKVDAAFEGDTTSVQVPSTRPLASSQSSLRVVLARGSERVDLWPLDVREHFHLPRRHGQVFFGQPRGCRCLS